VRRNTGLPVIVLVRTLPGHALPIALLLFLFLAFLPPVG